LEYQSIKKNTSGESDIAVLTIVLFYFREMMLITLFIIKIIFGAKD
jgi:hypothetical protein